MAQTTSIRLQNVAVGRIGADPSQMRADGESSVPTVIVPLEIALFQEGDTMTVVDRLAVTLWTRPPSGPRKRLSRSVPLDGIDSTSGMIVSLPSSAGPLRRDVRFELTPEALQALEVHVQSHTDGMAVQFSLLFELRLCWMRGLPVCPHPSSPGGAGFETVEGLPFPGAITEELVVGLSREHWARQIAPALGHDRLRLVAVAMPSADGMFGGRLVSMYDAASRAYDAAEWREAVQKCRDVRHHIEEEVGATKDERVAQIVATRSGITDDSDPRIEFLDSTWTALANVTNAASHIGSRGRLDAATAHAALLVTATMVQHVAELLGPA